MIWLPARRRSVESGVAAGHADGLSDRELARRFGCCMATVLAIRQRLGLAPAAPNGSARHGALSSAGRRAYARVHGCDPMARFRQLGRLAEIDRGWPCGVGPAQARQLAAFEERGPLTVAEWCLAVGRCRDTLNPLRGAGWVVVVGRRPVPGARRPHHVYDLAEAVKLGRRRLREVCA